MVPTVHKQTKEEYSSAGFLVRGRNKTSKDIEVSLTSAEEYTSGKMKA